MITPKKDVLYTILQLGLTQYYDVLLKSLKDGGMTNDEYFNQVNYAYDIVNEVSSYKFKEDQNANRDQA